MQKSVFFLLLLLWPVTGMAQTDLSRLFPKEEIAGWSRLEPPQPYHGDELFLMIDGGADIYFEYGFSQALAGDYHNEKGQLLRLELYEMTDPAAAYGVYTFKIGTDGQPLAVGQAASLADYYLHFWQGNLLVTIAGPDTTPETIEALTAFARFIDQRYSQQGEIPPLAQRLLSPPLSLASGIYVRGSIGVMNSYVFDTEDIFRVQEGMIGTVGDNRIFVFRYPDNAESKRLFATATTRMAAGDRFQQTTIAGEVCTMTDRDDNVIILSRKGQNIVAVIGRNRADGTALAERVDQQLATLRP
ncbi:MAG: DUF6599 family protein [Desulfopila sp.]